MLERTTIVCDLEQLVLKNNSQKDNYSFTTIMLCFTYDSRKGRKS